MRIRIAVVVTAGFILSGALQEMLAQSGVPASAFPKPNRPVADIVSPIWHDENERDNAGEAGQLVHRLGIKSGMSVADIGAGSGYYTAILAPVLADKGELTITHFDPNGDPNSEDASEAKHILDRMSKTPDVAWSFALPPATTT